MQTNKENDIKIAIWEKWSEQWVFHERNSTKLNYNEQYNVCKEVIKIVQPREHFRKVWGIWTPQLRHFKSWVFIVKFSTALENQILWSGILSWTLRNNRTSENTGLLIYGI